MFEIKSGESSTEPLVTKETGDEVWIVRHAHKKFL